jgi:hypothetical protein
MKSASWEKITPYGLYPWFRCGDTEPNESFDSAQVDACRQWIRAFMVPTKTIRRRHHSYGYKHRVENWTRADGKKYDQIDPWGRKWTGDYLYIANGAFIEAARLEGYRIARCHQGSPNAFFNMTHTRAT